MVSYKIFTLFPELIETYVKTNAPLSRGIEKKILQIQAINFREYSSRRHRKVDDEVYGGGPGMLIQPDAVVEAVRSHLPEGSAPRILIMDPKGKPFNQHFARELSLEKNLFLICGRYEGFDCRIAKSLKAEMVSLGDFVLTGGELAALALMDAAARLLEGTLDSFESQEEESFSSGWLEWDQYTRPPVFQGIPVPEELLSGNHQAISRWRKKNSLKNTIKNRPDLLKELNLNDCELTLIKNILKEIYGGHQ